jgi:hypothetical protein
MEGKKRELIMVLYRVYSGQSSREAFELATVYKIVVL